jgi:hypothetical protein
MVVRVPCEDKPTLTQRMIAVDPRLHPVDGVLHVSILAMLEGSSLDLHLPENFGFLIHQIDASLIRQERDNSIDTDSSLLGQSDAGALLVRTLWSVWQREVERAKDNWRVLI